MAKGSSLRAAGDGGAEVVRDGKRIVRVGRPSAADAQGQDVPVELAVEGDRLRLTVRHRDRDVAMPILVDPIFEDYWTSGNNWYDGQGLDRLASDWFFVETTPGGFVPRTACDSAVSGSCYGSGRGLQIYAAPGAYTAGQWGGWVYATTPGRTSYIAGAYYGWLWHNRHSDATNDSYAMAWLFNSDTQTFTGVNTITSPQAGAFHTVGWGDGGGVAADGPGTDMTSLSLMMPTAATKPDWTDVYAGGVFLFLDDPEAPTAAAPSHSVPVTGWHDDGEQITTTASATDPGLGVKHLNLTRSYAAIDQKTHPCAGTRSSPCPTEWSQQFSYSTSQMDEGTNTLQVSAYDPPLQLSNVHSWGVKVDRSRPDVALSGALWDQRGAALEPGQHALRIDAIDGSTSSPRSGVKSIEIKVDGTTVSGPAPEACPDGQCPYTLGRDWTFDTENFPVGIRTVEVLVKDLLGHTDTQSFIVRRVQPPETMISFGPEGTVSATSALFEFDSEPGGWSLSVV